MMLALGLLVALAAAPAPRGLWSSSISKPNQTLLLTGAFPSSSPCTLDCEGVGPARAFVHKPSEERMREKGLVRSTEHPDGSIEEWAFTDSAFFFDRAVAKKLLGFWEKDLGGNLACEVDCYGDFLQPLGPKADDSYLGNTTSNIVAGAGGSTSQRGSVRGGGGVAPHAHQPGRHGHLAGE